MIETRLDRLAAAFRLAQSRRGLLHGVPVPLFSATFPFTRSATADAATAPQRRKRRKRLARKRADRIRRRCLGACSEACQTCFYDAEGGIHCADGAGATCAESLFCDSNADCTGAICLTAFQPRGSSEIRPLADESCDFPRGICSALLICGGP